MTRHIDWSATDWTLRNREIAEKIGCTLDAVKSARRRYGKVGAGHGAGRRGDPFVLVSPDGQRFRIECLSKFIVSHRQMFDPHDLPDANRPSVCDCLAYYGLRAMRYGRAKNWKGWRCEKADV